MSNNIFYKALAAVSTVGIVVIAGIQVTTALKKGNNAEDQLAKTMVEIKNARKDALTEVKTTRSDLLKELNNIRSSTLNEIKKDRANALGEVKAAKKEALENLKASSNNDSKIWLVMRSSVNQGGNAIEKIAFPTMEQCQAAELQLESSDGFAGRARFFFTMCIDAR